MNVVNHAMDRPVLRPWWRKSRRVQVGVGIASVTLLAVATLAMLGSAQRSVRMPLGNVTIASVERGVFHDFIPLHAQVVALNTVYLDALEGGRVERILAQAGDVVAQGQPLVELSNTELELDVLDREGRLVESITQLQAYETELQQNRIANQKALAQIDYDIIRLRRSLERRKVLVARSLEAVDVADTIQDELDHALKIQPLQAQANGKQEQLRVEQLPQIQAQLDKLQQDLKITHSKLDNLVVRAPVSGRLTAMDLKVGENRNRGERFAEITPETGYKLAASIDEYYLARVRAGQAARVDIDERSWALTVERVYPQVKDGSFIVDLSFGVARPPGLIPGESVQGKLSLGADRLATILPAGTFLERTGGEWVFVLDADGHTARRRRIGSGRRNAEQLEVLRGLEVGDHVITSDYSGFERVERINLQR
jgi:HlyD family secretion protein